MAGSSPGLRIANSKPQPPDLVSRFSRSGINGFPGPLQAIGGGTGRSRRGLREATYNGLTDWTATSARISLVPLIPPLVRLPLRWAGLGHAPCLGGGGAEGRTGDLMAGCSPVLAITEPVRSSTPPQPRCSLRFTLPKQKTLPPTATSTDCVCPRLTTLLICNTPSPVSLPRFPPIATPYLLSTS